MAAAIAAAALKCCSQTKQPQLRKQLLQHRLNMQRRLPLQGISTAPSQTDHLQAAFKMVIL